MRTICTLIQFKQAGLPTDNCTLLLNNVNTSSHISLPWRESIFLLDKSTHVTIDVRKSQHAFQQAANSPVFLSYSDLVNVVVVVSSTRPSLSTATVVSAHYDSTFYSPGASDNGANIAVLFETFRLILESHSFPHSVIFLFNEAEECGLMGADVSVSKKVVKPQRKKKSIMFF